MRELCRVCEEYYLLICDMYKFPEMVVGDQKNRDNGMNLEFIREFSRFTTPF